MSPAARLMVAIVVEQCVPLAMGHEGWTLRDFRVADNVLRGSAISLRGSATRGSETADLLTGEIVSDEHGRSRRIQIVLKRPDHSHLRIERAIMVVITSSVTDSTLSVGAST